MTLPARGSCLCTPGLGAANTACKTERENIGTQTATRILAQHHECSAGSHICTHTEPCRAGYCVFSHHSSVQQQRRGRGGSSLKRERRKQPVSCTTACPGLQQAVPTFSPVLITVKTPVVLSSRPQPTKKSVLWPEHEQITLPLPSFCPLLQVKGR